MKQSEKTSSRSIHIGAASCLVLCSLGTISTPAEAQSSPQPLPPVVVQQPSRPVARTNAVRSRQATPTASRRRQAQRSPSNPDAASATPGTATETAAGPVRGYIANLSGTGTKTSTPLRETPQSITVVTADRIADQGATTVQESVRYVPGGLRRCLRSGFAWRGHTYSRPGPEHLPRRMRLISSSFFNDGVPTPIRWNGSRCCVVPHRWSTATFRLPAS